MKDFTVTQAINGGEAKEVTPSKAELSEDGLTVTLTVEKVDVDATADQSVVYTVNKVAAEAFDVAATPTPKVESVSAVNTNQVKVTFNTAVEDTTKVNFAVKKGAANYFYSVEWNETKTEAVITTTIKLPAADYVIEVSGLTETVITKSLTVEAEKVDSIAIISDSIDRAANAEISFEVRNQYGKDMKVAASNVTALAYNLTQKKAHTITADNLKFDFSADFATNNHQDEAKVGDEIRVTLTYNGVTTQKEITVQEAAVASTVELGTVSPLEGSDRIFQGDTGLTLPVTVLGQYGKSVKLDQTTANKDTVTGSETISGVTFTSSDTTIVDIDKLTVDADGKVTFSVEDKVGSATITAIVNATGEVSKTTVKVEETATVGEFNLYEPTSIVAGGDNLKVDYSVADQYGSVINSKLPVTNANADGHADKEEIELNGDTLTFTSSDKTIVNIDKITVDAKGVLTIPTEKKAGKVTITVKNGDTTVGTLSLDVQEASVPTKISKVNPAKTIDTNLVEDKEVVVKAENFIILDQYNREYTLSGTEGLVAWMSDGSETYIDLGDQSNYTKTGADNTDTHAVVLSNDNSTNYLKVKGKNANGTEKVKFALTTNTGAANASLVAGSEFELAFTNVAKPSDITVSTDKTKYTADEEITVTLTAKTADGKVFTSYNQSGFATIKLDTITYNKAVTFVNGVATVTLPATVVNADYDVHVEYDGETYEIGTISDGDIEVVAGAFDGFVVTAGASSQSQIDITAVDADGNTVASYSGQKLANISLVDKDGKVEALDKVDTDGNILVTFVNGVVDDLTIDSASIITTTDIVTVIIDGKTAKYTAS